MPLLTHIFKTLHLHDVTLFCNMMTPLLRSSHACVAGHVTFYYKRGCTWLGGVVLLPKTFKRLDRLKHALVAMHQVHPCNWSLLSSTVLSILVVCYLLCMFQNTHSSVPGKPRSATHSSTSTTSAGLLCLSVGAHVLYRRRLGRHQMSATHITHVL